MSARQIRDYAREVLVNRTHFAIISTIAAMLMFSNAMSASAIAPFAETPQRLIEIANASHAPDDADVNILDLQETTVYNADGSSTSTSYLAYKVLTTDGANNWNDVSTEWSPWLEQKPALKARVIANDGKVYALDPATITDSPAADAEQSIYSDRMKTRAPLPAIAIGAVVETEVVTHRSLPFAGAGDQRTAYLQFNQPLQHALVTLQAPPSIKLRYTTKLLPNVNPVHTSTPEFERWTFEIGNQPASEDVPEGLPSDTPWVPAVHSSTGNSWSDVVAGYSKIVNEQIAKGKVDELAKRLTQGLGDREAKINAIIAYLNKEIRYTGIEFSQASTFPHTPSETLSHKYGDCKDKSTLMVALLRAADISASLALLNVTDRVDIEPSLPGLDNFDHAIVYIPGSPSWWVDATDANAKLGQLPDDDRGRLALIVDEQTTALVTIPLARSTDNIDYSDREVILTDNGPARIIETSHPQGTYESSFRSWYGDLGNKKLKETLTDYLKSEYMAEKMDHADRSDPRNFSVPFKLTLQADRIQRGYTNLSEAHFYIPLSSLFQPLPNELKSRDLSDEENSKATKPKPKRSADFQIGRAFVTEWHYTVTPPAGFVPATLPEDVTIDIGPCVLTEKFSADAGGMVHATLRFDSVKQRYTISEQTAMKNKIADLLDGDAVKIKFDLLADVQKAQGHAPQAFQTLRDMIKQHPKAAIHHLRLADALLKIGLGSAARNEAQIAVKLEPKLALGQEELAIVLQHDLLGRRYLRGADLSGASAAYLKASELDTDNKSLIGNNAVLLEYNADGIRYGQGANLDAAIAEYRKLTVSQASDWGIPSNLSYALFYSRQFAAARDNAKTLKTAPLGLIIACEAELSDSQHAIQEARRLTATDAKFKETITTAANMVMQLRDYAKAADLFEAGVNGNGTSKTMALVATLRKTVRAETIKFENRPDDTLKSLMLVLMQPNLSMDKMKPFASKNALVILNRSTQDDIKKLNQVSQSIARSARTSGLNISVLTDIGLQSIQTKTYGDDAKGYRIVVQTPGQRNSSYFFVKENDQYKLLDTSDQPNALALEVLDRVERNDLDGASQLLEWLRDGQSFENGDDKFAGNPFTRYWLSGHRQPDALRIKVAAAMILAQQQQTATQGMALLESLKGSVTDNADSELIDLAITVGSAVIFDYEKALTYSRLLSQHSSTSRRAFLIQSWSLRGLKRYDEAMALAQQRLQENSSDIDAQRMIAETLSSSGRYQDAYHQIQKVIENSNAGAGDFNNLSWTTLFFDNSEALDVSGATRATQLSENSPSTLHTLGSIYAEQGKIVEAHDVMFHLLDSARLDQPEDNTWFILARIAEYAGEPTIAMEYYKLVSKPKDIVVIPTSTYQLAQRRLQYLSAHKPTGSASIH